MKPSRAKTWFDCGPMPVLGTRDLRGIQVDDLELVLVRGLWGVKVYSGLCPHQGALLAEGEIEDSWLVCRNHRWRFEAETGKLEDDSHCLQQYPCKFEGGHLWVQVDERRPSESSRERTLRKPRDLPGPRGVPVLGNARQIETNRFHEILEGWEREFGSVFTFRIATRRFVAISEPTLMAQVLRRRPKVFSRVRRMRPILKEMGIHGVLSAEGQEWRHYRNLALQALGHHRLHGFYETLREMAERLVKRWHCLADAEEIVDIESEFMRFTVDTTTKLALGHDAKTIEDDEDAIQHHLDQILMAAARRLRTLVPYWRVVRLPQDYRLERSLISIRDWVSPIVAEARRRVDTDPSLAENPSNFLEAMLSAGEIDGTPISDEEVTSNALMMLLAGEDTVANSLAWAVHHLLDAPNVVTSLVSEAEERLGNNLVPQDMAAVEGLEYTTDVVNESLRLSPAVPILFADCNERTVVGDIEITPGTSLVILLRSAGLTEKFIPDAQSFRPQRWLDSKESDRTQKSLVHIPFGSGPRLCPGRSLARLEMNLLLACLFKNFEVERVGESAEVREKFYVTMSPVGLAMRLRPRGGSGGSGMSRSEQSS